MSLCNEKMYPCTNFHPNLMIDDGNGRYKLWINAILRYIKYLKILKRNDSRYVRKV